MFPVKYTFIPRQPVVVLDDRRPRQNRKLRRNLTHGKQHEFDKIRGFLSPKEHRELLG